MDLLWLFILICIVIIFLLIYFIKFSTVDNVTEKFELMLDDKVRQVLKSYDGKIITGGDIVVFSIMALNPIAFGLPGATIWPVFSSLSNYQDIIKYFPTKHESIASFAAIGYGAMCQSFNPQKVAFVISTSGPGVFNTFPGIYNASYEFYPLVIISGNVNRKNLKSKNLHAFQKVDFLNTNMDFIKKKYQVWDSSEIVKSVGSGYHKSQSHGVVSAGPVLIDIPIDVLTTEIKFDYNLFLDDISSENNVAIQEEIMVSDQKYIYVASLLAKSFKPFVVIGRGIITARKSVWKFIEKYGLPFGYTLKGKGLIPDDHPQCYGYIGMHGLKTSNEALFNSDLVLIFGALGDDRTFPNINKFTKGNIIIFNHNPENYTARQIERHIYITEDISESMIIFENALNNEMINKNRYEEWNRYLRKEQETEKIYDVKNNIYLSPPRSLSPILVYQHLNKILLDIDILVLDVGTHQQQAARFIKLKANIYDSGSLYGETDDEFMNNYRKQVLTSGSAGTMATSIAYAVGAHVAVNGSLKIIIIIGDGCFEMLLNALWLLTYGNFPIPCILINDGVYNEIELNINKNDDKKDENEQLYLRNTLPNKNVPLLGQKGAEMYSLSYKKIATENDLVKLDKISYGITEMLVYSVSAYPLILPGKTFGDTKFSN